MDDATPKTDPKDEPKIVKLKLEPPKWRLLRGLSGLENRTQAEIVELALMSYAQASAASGNAAVKGLLEQVS